MQKKEAKTTSSAPGGTQGVTSFLQALMQATNRLEGSALKDSTQGTTWAEPWVESWKAQLKQTLLELSLNGTHEMFEKREILRFETKTKAMFYFAQYPVQLPYVVAVKK